MDMLDYSHVYSLKKLPTGSMKKIYVKKSLIHGKGLFAKEKISAGELIGVVKGKPTDTDGPYVLWVDGINGFEVNCQLRFINHSDKPNAVYYNTLEVCALRDILVNEEITHNYSVED